MFFIMLVGLFLRLTFIDKTEGLWNDEYVSWLVASADWNNIWSEILKQCHMPLYYIYLKPFTGYSDFAMRLTSVIPGVLSIYIMYKAGTEYSKKTGIYAGALTSFLSFLIYYSQEVRFYSLIFLLSACSLLFTIRIIKKSSKLNIFGYIFCNLLIVFTHVLGVIYVFFNTLYVLYKKYAQKRFSKKTIVTIFSALIICSIPIVYLGINILNQLPSSQWWGKFSYTNILFLFSDFFSPVLTNKVNAPPVFFYNKSLAIWLTIPTLITLYGIFLGFKKNKGIITVSFFTLCTLFVLAASGKIVFITKYATEVLPIFIIAAVCGFADYGKRGLILLCLFVSFHIASFFTPHYVTKIIRSEGHRLPCKVIEMNNPDVCIFTYYAPDRFERYLNCGCEKKYISKINRFDYVNKPAAILSDIKRGEKITVVFLQSVSFLPEEIVSLNKDNKNIPEMFLTFSHIKNELIKEIKDKYTNIDYRRTGDWLAISGIKK